MNTFFKFILAGALSITAQQAMAQVPNKFNYQAAVRNASGGLVVSQNVGVKISITDGAAALYSEERSVTTTPQGIMNIQIGGVGATNTTGDITTIDWSTGDKFVKVEADVAGGTNYADMGGMQLLSVPYASATNGVKAKADGSEVHLTTSGASRLSVNTNGNVGVGTTTPAYRLQVDGITGTFNDNGIRINNTTASSGWSFYSSSSGALIIGRTGNLGQFDGTTGVYSSLSDERMKTNVEDIESVLVKVTSLKPKRYEYKNDNPAHAKTIGFLAQEVRALFPEFVTVNTTNEGNPQVEQQMGLDYASMSVIAIKAIQEQQEQIELLKAKITALEAKAK